MREELPLFDAIAAREAAEKGIGRAAENKASLLKFARGLAVGLGVKNGRVTADDVQRAMVDRGISERALGNAAGALFRGPRWRFTGETVKSVRVHSHGRLIRVWQYTGA